MPDGRRHALLRLFDRFYCLRGPLRPVERVCNRLFGGRAHESLDLATVRTDDNDRRNTVDALLRRKG